MTSEFREMWSVKAEGATQHEGVMIHGTGTVTPTASTTTIAATVSSITITVTLLLLKPLLLQIFITVKCSKMCSQNGSAKDEKTWLKV